LTPGQKYYCSTLEHNNLETSCLDSPFGTIHFMVMAQVTQALAGIALTPLSGNRQSVSRTRNASSARRSVTCQAAKEENEAVKNRTDNQKALAGVDGAIRKARDDLGKSFMNNFNGPLKMLGIGKKNPNQKKTGLAQWEEQRVYLLANTKSVSASEVGL
jgi:hypothetical protein